MSNRANSYECRSCGDTVTPGSDAKSRTVRGIRSAEYCGECFRELAFGKIPDPELNRGPCGYDTDGQNREYHGGQYHRGEW